jgi:hypothetical protein
MQEQMRYYYIYPKEAEFQPYRTATRARRAGLFLAIISNNLDLCGQTTLIKTILEHDQSLVRRLFVHP